MKFQNLIRSSLNESGAVTNHTIGVNFRKSAAAHCRLGRTDKTKEPYL